ncbi:Abhydrolase domain-containing protein mpaH [Lachnellula arida]|uniref:Abhydrolase domain-containing protein mpaH n=1 Tax=Lachnellula arida TaxID=1316785 RepID=A0A8T9BN93_9HELO|nr:Abhydrolase domain-containing protein mpaH [Lachnellula arida]
MSQSIFQVTEHTVPAQHIREYPNGVNDLNSQLQLAVKEYRPRDNLHALNGSVTIIAAHANGCPKECYEALWDALYHELKNQHAIRAIWIADISNQGASGVLNEKVQGDDHAAPKGPNCALPSSYRPDFWPSRSAAEVATRKTRFFRSWDPRALDNYLQYGLRSTPTAVYPEPENAGGVTLTTTKHQEAWSFIRSNFAPMAANQDDRSELLRAPDLSPEHRTHLFHRPEMVAVYRSLPNVRPHVLWIFGEKSIINPPEVREDLPRRTGTGVGGNGGVNAGQVEDVTFTDGQHMLPVEKTREVAQSLASWLEKRLIDYRQVEDWYKRNKSEKSERDMLVLSKDWLKNVRQKENTPRSGREKL